MSLNIFIDEQNVDKSRLIFDVESFFTGTFLRNDDFTRRVLKEIEDAKYQNEVTFIDRFGLGLYTSCLSTTSKILLAVKYN